MKSIRRVLGVALNLAGLGLLVQQVGALLLH